MASSDQGTDLRGLEGEILRYFGMLSPAGRKALFEGYERLHGRPARLWAERTSTAWLAGRAGLSRQTAERLFELTPQHLAERERQELARTLWERYRESSQARLRVPTEYHDGAQIMDLLRDHYARQFTLALLPDALPQRYPWLAAPEIQAQQQVLNLLLAEERDRLLEVANEQIQVLVTHAPEAVRKIRQRIDIGGHSVEVFTDPDVSEPILELVATEAPPRSYRFLDSMPMVAMAGFTAGMMLAVTLLIVGSYLRPS